MYSGTVAIVMATYNGVRYIKQQIESIQAQSYQNWILFIRDDGSVDGTVELVKACAEKDRRIRIIEDGDKEVSGATANFEKLLSVVADSHELILLSDQDDVWHTEKVQKMLNAVPLSQIGSEPLLVHSDLRVVDKNLCEITSSFISTLAVKPNEGPALKKLLGHNYVTGCTTLVNRKLLQKALPFPAQVVIHDWWLALVAAMSGRVIYLPESLVDYRQHDTNVVGSRTLVGEVLGLLRSPVKKYQMLRNNYHGVLLQANALKTMTNIPQQRKVIDEFVDNSVQPFGKRKLTFFMSDYAPKSKVWRVIFWGKLLLFSRSKNVFNSLKDSKQGR